ncbi:uncharacterized protein EDB91DRAFT_304329 [Suillus paluster]|uniref:uncharacterized protein n=1 Tax=Suillus paluster TaxID=48578 RepID=UPI001B860080|nr:uncharacterized protein EDB91DRAFT_304329 [Suillus paluster]KAG1742289.1 hypothetical protein EDB91DRAFT_304329 [Suillus paluster]
MGVCRRVRTRGERSTASSKLPYQPPSPMGQARYPSALTLSTDSGTRPKEVSISHCKSDQPLPPLPPDAPEYFRADIPVDSELISIIQNDWPYSVPIEIEHTLIWSRVPIFHPAFIPAEIACVDRVGNHSGESRPQPKGHSRD